MFSSCSLDLRIGWQHCIGSVYAGSGKTLESFSLIDCVSVGVDRMQRNFEPIWKQVEAWRRSELTDVTAKVVIYEAFVEGMLDAPNTWRVPSMNSTSSQNMTNSVPRTIWSLSNAFTSDRSFHRFLCFRSGQRATVSGRATSPLPPKLSSEISDRFPVHVPWPQPIE